MPQFLPLLQDINLRHNKPGAAKERLLARRAQLAEQRDRERDDDESAQFLLDWVVQRKEEGDFAPAALGNATPWKVLTKQRTAYNRI